RVAVSGASGYARGEVLRLLAAHPEVGSGTVAAHSSAGELPGPHQPHLRPLARRGIAPTPLENLVDHDGLVLALPHGASAAVAAELEGVGNDVLVLDCGADHRIVDADAWTSFYGSPHAGWWPYGMPELMLADGSRQRDRLAGARRVAVPGC